MNTKPSESNFEATTIERFTRLGYEHDFGAELREDEGFVLEAVVLVEALRRHLRASYSTLTPEAVETAVRIITNPEGVTLLQRNMNSHRLLTRGFEVRFKDAKGAEWFEHVYPVNWDEPAKNDFRVVSQLPIRATVPLNPPLVPSFHVPRANTLQTAHPSWEGGVKFPGAGHPGSRAPFAPGFPDGRASAENSRPP